MLSVAVCWDSSFELVSVQVTVHQVVLNSRLCLVWDGTSNNGPVEQQWHWQSSHTLMAPSDVLTWRPEFVQIHLNMLKFGALQEGRTTTSASPWASWRLG